MKKVLITGIAGFIGSHVAEIFLENGIRVSGIDNLSTGKKENLESFYAELDEFIKDDLVNISKYFQTEKFDAIIHLAALADVVPSIKQPRKYFESNVSGTLSVIEFANQREIKKIIYSASSSCYGIPDIFPTTEDSPIDTRYPYSLTKYQGEELLRHFSLLYDFNCISLRLFNVYGPRARTNGTYGAVFGVFLKQIIEGEAITIVGDGEQKRDFIYVTDVASAFLKAYLSEKNGFNIYNIGNSNPVSINTLAKLLKPSKIVNIPDRPGEPRQTFANITKAKSELKWEPKVKFKDGVDLMLRKKEEWRNAPLWDVESIANETMDWFKYVK